MQTMIASVTAATASRLFHDMPRLTHHNSAQLMMTGAMISSDGKLTSALFYAPSPPSAADLKSLHHLLQIRFRDFKSISGTRIIKLLVLLMFPKLA
jgi:hypothetical protein